MNLFFVGKLDRWRGHIVTRFNASEKAVDLLHADQVRVPTLLDREMGHEREVWQAKLDGLGTLVLEKFSALAILTDKLRVADSTALTAALSAAEKAVGEQNRSSSLAITKSEQGMQEALKQLQTTFQTEIKGITAIIAVMQSRLDRGEGVERQVRDQGIITRAGAQYDQGSSANIIAIVAVAIAAIALVVSLILPHLSH